MVIARRRALNLGTLLDSHCATGGCLLSWLGQAGFVIRDARLALVIDAYLSDSLAKKYRNSTFPHIRLMPAPIAPERLAPIGVVLCTHAHTDHMDPETVSVLAERNPHARFVVPRACRETALARGIPGDRVITVNAGERVQVASELAVRALASAHEELLTDERGNHQYLGYVMEFGDAVIYHSGDCVPYPGIADQLAELTIDLAILPVNGRDDHRRRNGVPGNFTFSEAASLCVRAGIRSMIPCHFGMFDFNTLDESILDQQIANVSELLQCIRPQPGQVYELDASGRPAREDSLPSERIAR